MKRTVTAWRLLACAVVLFLSTPGEVMRASVSAAGQEDRGLLVSYAARARQQGKASVEIVIVPDSALDSDFDFIRSELAFFVATRTTKPPVVASDSHSIRTWHTLRLETMLSGSHTGCRDNIPEVVQVEPGEFAVGFVGGTVNVEGVAVTMTLRTLQPSLEIGRRYLFIGSICTTGEAILTFSDSSVIPVASDGKIGPSSAPYPHTFVGEIVGFGHLAELERRLRRPR